MPFMYECGRRRWPWWPNQASALDSSLLRASDRVSASCCGQLRLLRLLAPNPPPQRQVAQAAGEQDHQHSSLSKAHTGSQDTVRGVLLVGAKVGSCILR